MSDACRGWTLRERDFVHVQVLRDEVRIDDVAVHALGRGVVEEGLRRVVVNLGWWLRDLELLNRNRLVVLGTRRKTAKQTERESRRSYLCMRAEKLPFIT